MLNFLKRIFSGGAAVFAVVAALVLSATDVRAQQESAGTPAVVVVQALPGTVIFQDFVGQRVRVGVVPEDGLLILDDTLYAGKYCFVFEHEDAAEPTVIDDVVLKAGSAKKLAPVMKMKKGELVVTCLPTDAEIFVDGKHAARGSLVSGEYEIGRELTVEVRSSVYGSEIKRVRLEKGRPARLNFDLRGRVPVEIPDGKIVLSDVALVLARQPAAVVKVDGAGTDLKNNRELLNLKPGVRRVEISFPLDGELVPVWRGAFKALSAIMDGADNPSELLDWDALESNRAAASGQTAAPAPALPAPAPAVKTPVVPAGTVEMTLSGDRVILSMTEGASELVPGAVYRLKRAGKNEVAVKISTVAGATATALLPVAPAGDDALAEGETFSLELAGLAADVAAGTPDASSELK